MSTTAIARLRRRLNALAYDLVHEELARLDQENEALRSAVLRAEESADYWREQCLQALESTAAQCQGHVAMAPNGQLLVLGGATHG